MNRERDLKTFLNRFIGEKGVVGKKAGSEFIEMNEEERTKVLTEFAEELEIDPKTINITALAQIEAKNFQEFIEKVWEKTQPEP